MYTGDVHAVSSLAAHDVAVKSGALAQILIWTSIAEAISVVAVTQMLEGSGRAVSRWMVEREKRERVVVVLFIHFDSPTHPPTHPTQPGDFKFDPLGFAKDEQSLKKLQLNELKNGRLAMLAFSGIVTQAALTGHSFPYL